MEFGNGAWIDHAYISQRSMLLHQNALIEPDHTHTDTLRAYHHPDSQVSGFMTYFY